MKKLLITAATIVMLAPIVLPAPANGQGRLMTCEEATDMILSDGFRALKEGDSQLAYDLFRQVAAASPHSEASGTANFTLGNAARKTGDLECAKEYYRRGFNSRARIAADSGISLANVYYAEGKKTQAIETFIMVRQRFPNSEQADIASLKTGMCYVGMARTDIKNRSTLKKLALNFLAQSKNGEARIQELGILWELAVDGQIPWQEALNKLESFENDNPHASDSAKARAILMQAEQAFIVDEYQRCIDKAQQVVDKFPNAKREYYAALYNQACAIQELGRDWEAIPLFEKVVTECKDQWNFGGNDVRASAAYWRIESLKNLGLQQDADGAIDQFRKDYPGESFYTPFLEAK